jgi:cytochrome oxidase assembly protein ShyY1
MIRRLPVIPTILVACLVAALISAGIWNLRRVGVHQAEIAKFEAASRLPPVSYPNTPMKTAELPMYRYATGNCLRAVDRRTSAGENASGEPGFVVIFDCATGAEGPGISVQVGWSKYPNDVTPWKVGLVSGVIVPDNKTRIRLVSESAAPGLESNARPRPSVSVSPAQNRGYAIQFFAFALTALIIYGLAVRKRLTGTPR